MVQKKEENKCNCGELTESNLKLIQDMIDEERIKNQKPKWHIALSNILILLVGMVVITGCIWLIVLFIRSIFRI